MRPTIQRLGTIILILATFVSPFSATPVEAERLTTRRRQKNLSEAKRLLEAGRDVEAVEIYRRLLFAFPGNKKFERKIREIVNRSVEALVEKARKRAKTNYTAAIKILKKAHKRQPNSTVVAREFKKLDYRFFLGKWRSPEQIQRKKQRIDKQARERRAMLGLSDKFEIIKQTYNDEVLFRFFTDVDTRQARSLLRQVQASSKSLYGAYIEFMGPFGVKAAKTPIDIVLFNDKGRYVRVTGAPGRSAGVYIPSRGASFFYRSAGTYSFPTLLHEITHQLNDKVLGGLSVSGWFEEGIAEYFGAGSLSKGGKRIKLGRVDPYRLRAFQAATRGTGRQEFIPLEKFLALGHVQLTGQYYAEAWALVHYLLEGHGIGRFVLFDFIRSGIEERRGQGKVRELEEVLRSYGISLRALETKFVEHFREGKQR
jgi:signal recognition particle receptor subunit beta